VREIEDSMSQVEMQLSRCAKITQAILKFGRQGEPAVQDIEINRFIGEVADMIEKKAAVNGIVFIKQLDAVKTRVRGDPSQLQQVLLNLFNNAMDAIVEKHGPAGGQLTIATRSAADGQVEILVRDNGCGIAAADKQKIFTPFFTTKPVGRGTGLGLAVCYGIITNMNGSMDFDSRAGEGSTFILRLPLSGAA